MFASRAGVSRGESNGCTRTRTSNIFILVYRLLWVPFLFSQQLDLLSLHTRQHSLGLSVVFISTHRELQPNHTCGK